MGYGLTAVSKRSKEISVTEYDGTHEERSDRFTAIEDRFAGYTVYDQNYDKIGKVDDLFVDENDQPEYIGVKMGFLGTRSTLIPMDLARVNDERQLIEVAADKETVKDGPTFDDDREITPDFENEVYSYFGLQRSDAAENGAYYSDEETAGTGTAGPGITMGDIESGTFREHPPGEEGVYDQAGSDPEDELRVQRTEEELTAGTREREAGALNVRKRVRIDHETVEAPTRHEEVTVERVPVEGEATASEAEIGDEEVRVPVTEEEVLMEKRPVAKEEIRVRKDVVEDVETVEEDVRREEVDVEDQTERRNR
jgi:uncharacterized protein (TIGR02271 family)